MRGLLLIWVKGDCNMGGDNGDTYEIVLRVTFKCARINKKSVGNVPE